MNRIRFFAAVCAATLCTLVSCTKNNELPQESLGGDRIEVPFSITGLETRSSITVADNGIKHFDLYAFTDGTLADSFHSDNLDGAGRSGISLRLYPGRSYTFYALANHPTRLTGISELDIQNYIWDVSGGYASVNSNGFPMCWTGSATISNGTRISIGLDRLLSKWTFTFDMSNLPTLRAKSVVMKQTASGVAPFKASYTATSSSSTGDRSISADITAINAGRSATFYVPENMQGTLLPNNTSSYGKTYDALVAAGKSAQAARCTYLEVIGEFDESGSEPPYSGEIIYRFYLGKNLTTNFDIERNTEYAITIKPSVDSPTSEAIVWEVDNSGVTVNEWVHGTIEYSHTVAQYNGQWGYIDFPEATASDMVRVTLDPSGRNYSLNIGSSTLCNTTVGAYDIFYNPSVSRTRLWYRNREASDFRTGGLAMLFSQQGRNSVSTTTGGCRKPMKVITEDYLTFDEIPSGSSVSTSIPSLFTVCEDGINKRVYVTLADHTGSTVLDLRSFQDPVGYSSDRFASLYSYHGWEDDYFDYSDSWISSSRSYAYEMDFDKTTDQYDRPIDYVVKGVVYNRNYLYDAVIYGLDALGEATDYALVLESDSMCEANFETTVRVTPVVCDLRDLGKVLNNQVAYGYFGEDRNRVELTLSGAADLYSFSVLSLFEETPLCANSQDKIRDMLLYGTPSSQFSATLSSGKLSITFYDPVRTTVPSVDYDRFSHPFASGCYALVSSGTNPHNGKSFYKRCYLVDVALHIPVGLSVVALIPSGTANSQFSLAVMPWTLNYSDKRAYPLWIFIESLPGIISYRSQTSIPVSYNCLDADMYGFYYDQLPMTVPQISATNKYGNVWSADINTAAHRVFGDLTLLGSSSSITYADGTTIRNASEQSFTHDRKMIVAVTLANSSYFINDDYHESCYVFEHYKRDYWNY